MAERCTVHRLPVGQLEDAVADPALAALLSEGWDTIGSVVVDAGDGRGPVLHLLLRPPRPTPAQGSAGNAAVLGSTAVPAWAWALFGMIVGLGTAAMAVLAW